MTRRKRLGLLAALVLCLHGITRIEARRPGIRPPPASVSTEVGAGVPALAALARGSAGEARDGARLELAHRHRRAGAFEAAVRAYERLLTDARAGARKRDEAAWWWARTQELSGNIAAAERGWRRVSLEARDPCMRVRAWDRLARSRFRAGDVDGACRALHECESALGPAAAQSSPQGAAVRASLASMLVRRRLETTDSDGEVSDFFLRDVALTPFQGLVAFVMIWAEREATSARVSSHVRRTVRGSNARK